MFRRVVGLVVSVCLALALSAGSAAAKPFPLVVTFLPVVHASFAPGSIAPNGKSWFNFTIENKNPSTTFTNLHFTVTVPAGLSLPDAPNGGPMCNYNGSVVLNGSTITVQNVKLGPKSTCVIPVHVKGDKAGTYTVKTTKIFSNEGTGFATSAILKVAAPATPKPTAKPAGTPVATATPSAAPSESATPTDTPSPGPSATATATPTATPVVTASPQPTPQPVVGPNSTSGGDPTPLIAVIGALAVAALGAGGLLFVRRRRGAAGAAPSA